GAGRVPETTRRYELRAMDAACSTTTGNICARRDSNVAERFSSAISPTSMATHPGLAAQSGACPWMCPRRSPASSAAAPSGKDFHVAMPVPAEALPGRHSVLVDDAQRAEAHVRRIVVTGKGERVPAHEPAMV